LQPSSTKHTHTHTQIQPHKQHSKTRVSLHA